MVFVVLYVICTFVCLNKFVIVRIRRLKYVKVVLIFVGCDVVCVVVVVVVVMLDLLIYSMNVLYGESIIFHYCLYRVPFFLFLIWV